LRIRSVAPQLKEKSQNASNRSKQSSYSITSSRGQADRRFGSALKESRIVSNV